MNRLVKKTTVGSVLETGRVRTENSVGHGGPHGDRIIKYLDNLSEVRIIMEFITNLLVVYIKFMLK